MAIGALLGGLGGLLSGGASIFSGLFGGSGGIDTSGIENAIMQAASMEKNAAQKAIKLQREALGEARQYMDPFYSAGKRALTPYQNMLGIGNVPEGFDPTAQLMSTPGYQWMQEQGVNALDRSAAAGGLLGSGAHRQGLLDYGQNLAVTKAYDPYMNRLAGLISGGQSAAGSMAGYGLNTASTIGPYLMQGAQAYGQGLSDVAALNALGLQDAQFNERANWNRLMGGLGIVTGTLQNPQFTNALGNLWGGNSAQSLFNKYGL